MADKQVPIRVLPARVGFSLVELLVVIGIIATLTGMLLPALARARDRANCTKCASNMQQVGAALLVYCNENRGWLFPVGPTPPPPAAQIPTTLGTNVAADQRWTAIVFGVYDPPIMFCPSDDTDPADEHSYVVNQHLADHQITYDQSWSTQGLGGLYNSDVVVMGEKVTDQPDYYMEEEDFQRVVEQYRHGISYGSNYLYLDLHVSTTPPNAAESGMDPWDPPVTGPTTAPGT